MTTFLIVLHTIVCVFLICIVLLQHGKGADIGASFGSSNQSLFGAEGPVSLLNKITTFAAIIFMCTSIGLAYLSSNKNTGSLMSGEGVQKPVAPIQQGSLPVSPTPEKPVAAGQAKGESNPQTPAGGQPAR